MTDPHNTGEDETLETSSSDTSEDTSHTENSGDMGANLEDEISLLKDKLARSQADYQNLVKRHDRDTAELGFILIAPIMKKLLPTLDNLERALESKKDVIDDAWVNGIRSTYEGLVKTLDSLGVKSFTSLGKEVDSELHDVMTQGPGKEGFITAEMEKGYMLHDRVLRHAKVVVGSGQD